MPIFDQFSSTNLGLSYVAPAQAQKHVTVNESFRKLDAVIQLSVIDKDLENPPQLPAEGERYIVADGANGDWTGHENNIAAYQDGTWYFHIPKIGWQTYVVDKSAIFVFDGTDWVDFFGSTDADTIDGIDSTGFFRLGSSSTQSASGNLQLFKNNPFIDITRDSTMVGEPTLKLRTNNRYDRIQNTPNGLHFGYNYSGTEKTLLWNGTDLLLNGQNVYHVGNLATGNDNVRFGQLGIGGASADATNVMSMKGPAALFNHGGNSIQIKLNKNAVGDTASFLFQNGFSGRAEIGLTGDDNFHFKVSSDGSNWTNAINIDGATGKVGIGTGAPTSTLHVDGAIRSKAYTVATLPSASSNGAGSMIYVSDETGGAVMAFSDGTNWCRFTDRAVVS